MNDAIFQTHEYIIGGTMIVGRAEMDESLRMMLQDGHKDAVKEKLIHEMASYMLENNLVEFTHHYDPMTMRRRIAVRAYLAPNDQVRILRLSKQL